MGFNLEMFLEELKRLLDSDLTGGELKESITFCVERNEQYAKESGAIK